MSEEKATKTALDTVETNLNLVSGNVRNLEADLTAVSGKANNLEADLTATTTTGNNLQDIAKGLDPNDTSPEYSVAKLQGLLKELWREADAETAKMDYY